jgi:hypothetical protein
VGPPAGDAVEEVVDHRRGGRLAGGPGDADHPAAVEALGEQADLGGDRHPVPSRHIDVRVGPRLGDGGVDHQQVAPAEGLLAMAAQLQAHLSRADQRCQEIQRRGEALRRAAIGDQHPCALRRQPPGHAHAAAEPTQPHHRHLRAAQLVDHGR